jgi:MerR family regulatory protein
MRIGELAKRAGVSTSKLRFYEARGVRVRERCDRQARAAHERAVDIVEGSKARCNYSA